MELLEQIKSELNRGFTKTELEKIWQIPLNSLSGVLNPNIPAKLSKKSEIRIKSYFETSLENRPSPTPKISKIKKTKEK